MKIEVVRVYKQAQDTCTAPYFHRLVIKLHTEVELCVLKSVQLMNNRRKIKTDLTRMGRKSRGKNEWKETEKSWQQHFPVYRTFSLNCDQIDDDTVKIFHN